MCTDVSDTEKFYLFINPKNGNILPQTQLPKDVKKGEQRLNKFFV